MVFTKEDGILIKVLSRVRVTVPESCWRNFLARTGLVQHWTNFCGRLMLCRQEVRQQQRRYGLHKSANGDYFQHKL